MNDTTHAVSCTEELLRPGSTVAVLGAAARTWYMDHSRVAEVVWWLLETGAHLQIGGKLPFDALIESAVAEADYPLSLSCFGPVTVEERLRLRERDPCILEGADLVVAFPVQGRDVLSADPLVEYALLSELPVLAVYRDALRWFTVNNYVFG